MAARKLPRRCYRPLASIRKEKQSILKRLVLFSIIGIPTILWIITQLYVDNEINPDNKTMILSPQQNDSIQRIKENNSSTFEKYNELQKFCDTIYDSGEILPKFKEGKNELMRFNVNHVIPVLSNLYEYEGYIITKLYYTLIISKSGQIIDVIIQTDIPQKYKDELKRKIYTMPNWIPGEFNGVKVCMKYHYPINCIKWDYD